MVASISPHSFPRHGRARGVHRGSLTGVRTVATARPREWSPRSPSCAGVSADVPRSSCACVRSELRGPEETPGRGGGCPCPSAGGRDDADGRPEAPSPGPASTGASPPPGDAGVPASGSLCSGGGRLCILHRLGPIVGAYVTPADLLEATTRLRGPLLPLAAWKPRLGQKRQPSQCFPDARAQGAPPEGPCPLPCLAPSPARSGVSAKGARQTCVSVRRGRRVRQGRGSGTGGLPQRP